MGPDRSAGLPGRLQADLARLDLLARHGGVWADATCFCVRPLDDWLLPCLPSGFFAFDRPGPDRLLSTWFLAAQPGNALVSGTFALMRDYLSLPMRLDEHAFLVKALTRLLRGRPRTRGWWFDPALRAGLARSRISPCTTGSRRSSAPIPAPPRSGGRPPGSAPTARTG